jgi:flagellar biosynthesis chaperone FliJ
MKREIERLAFLKGFKIGLITSKNNIEVDNYINKLDQEISNIENNISKEEPVLDTTKVETTTKNNTTNMYNLLQHINNKVN